MKNVRFFANVVKTVAACVVMGLVFASCNKEEDSLGAANAQDQQASLVITEKEEPKDSLWNDTIRSFRNDSIIVVINYYKNDTIIDKKNYGALVSASILREFNKLQTTEARLANPDFTFGEVSSSTNGKNQVVAKQTIQDGDGQNYTGQTTSGKIFNIYAELVSFKKTNLQNTDLEPGKDEAKLVNTKISWTPVVRIVNAPNLAGQEFELTTNSTEHLRFIPKNAPKLVKRDDWNIWKETGNWSTVWHFECNEYWSNDSVAPKSKLATLKGSYSRKDLDDKTVSGFDYTHPAGDLKWGNYAEIESKDAGVKLFEKKGTKKAYATNGFDADKFDTEFTVTMQKADVMFCDSLFHVESDEATLTNQRNVFVDEDSDRDGYQMVRFTDTELAQWAGQYDQKLDESCKLYLKVAEPELVKFLFDQEVKHTTDKVTVTTTGTPVYDNGAKGESVNFVLEEPETFKCLDEFAFEKVAEVSETTGAMEKDGEVVKTKQTKNVKSGEYTGTYTYYKYEQKYRQPITCNGETKYQHWLATWYDDFSFVVKSFENKNYAKVASYSASVEKDANHLTKNTSLSTEDLEVWLYSINGTFKLDNVERKDIGNGRITKVVIGENYWDESTKGREITALEVKSWCEFIRFKSDGTKTSQKYTHVFNRVSGTSTWEVSAEKAEEVNGNIIPLAPVDNNRIDDFCHFTARLYEYDMTVDIQGAAQQKDFAKFTEAEEMYFEVEGKKVYFENPTHSISNTVRNLTVKSESDSETVYQHENVWSWNYGGVVTEVTSTGLIHVAKSAPVTPDFDIEVGSIFASVSRPSNRNASDITAYTYLLVSKDGKKCLPLGIYHDVVTVGEITDMQAGFNSACYVKDQNKVVATRAYSDSGLGMMLWCGADGNPVDAASHLVLQGAGFNDRGNDWINHTGKYAPKATKKGNVTVVTFEGTNVSYTFKGWNVQ